VIRFEDGRWKEVTAVPLDAAFDAFWPEPFDSEDVTALAEAQQAEMRGRYEGVADIGPTRVADMSFRRTACFSSCATMTGARSVVAGSAVSTRPGRS